MNTKTLATALWLALALTAAAGHAEDTALAAPQQPAMENAVDPASIKALKDMGAFLQTLKRFQITNSLTGERVLADGQKLQHEAHADIDVVRPDKLYANLATARSQREIFYDGKQVTLYAPQQKYYSTAEFSGTLATLVSKMEQRYGIELPLSDLFLWGTEAAPTDGIESAMNAGQDFIGDDLCDHYAFRQGDIDWQIWILNGDKPLPRKLVITNRADEARPQSVSLIEWNLKPTFKETEFTFKPPKDGVAVEFHTVDKQ